MIAAKKTTNKHEIVEERTVKLQCRHPRYTHAVILFVLFVLNSVYIRGKSLDTGFVHVCNVRNPGLSRTSFALFPGVFQGYL